jgi:hypothetical protein
MRLEGLGQLKKSNDLFGTRTRDLLHRTVTYQKTQSILRYKAGRAIAQVVSRRLSTAAARVRAQFMSCGICCGQSATGAGFHQVLGFSCQFSFHRVLHIYHPVQVQ